MLCLVGWCGIIYAYLANNYYLKYNGGAGRSPGAGVYCLYRPAGRGAVNIYLALAGLAIAICIIHPPPPARRPRYALPGTPVAGRGNVFYVCVILLSYIKCIICIMYFFAFSTARGEREMCASLYTR